MYPLCDWSIQLSLSGLNCWLVVVVFFFVVFVVLVLFVSFCIISS
jgi:hypothetical protein